MRIADAVRRLCQSLDISFVFKSSFDKANRTSLAGARGPGLEEGLRILEAVRDELEVPVITDIHNAEQAAAAAAAVDVLQVPAFLCRQTDLLLAAGATGLPVMLKKGQFMHPQDMRFGYEKVAASGNQRILLCERGSCFGYRDLVVDMRSLVMMRELQCPVIFDATHSVQLMGGAGGCSSGARQYCLPLAKAAAAVGIDGIFLECHEAPERAPSDGATMIPLSEVESFLKQVLSVWRASLH
jgi:2-dehydro-3-deoxyphosphooctonate aldolase (KDO 8-P synthase)